VAWVGGAAAISDICPLRVLATVTGRFDQVGSRRKLRMALASSSDGITSGCRSLVEGVLMLILQSDLMGSISPPQIASIGGLASGKLHL
jgi:hypothetical protein